jgi:hypothetical protein
VATVTPMPPTPVRTRPPLQTGRLLAGLLVAALGVVWLLQALGAATVDWRVILPIAVVAVGVALLLAGFAGRGSGGLIALGIVLVLLLAATSAVDVPFTGGVGDRTYRPSGSGSKTYELAIGELTVDLGRLTGEMHVTAHVGVGQLTIVVPSVSSIHVSARAGIGQVVLFGEERTGFDASLTRTSRTPSPLAGSADLDVSVGLGQVEVRRG